MAEDVNIYLSQEVTEVSRFIAPKITISDEIFLKEDRFNVPFQKIGYDENGRKFFMKSNATLFPREGNHSIDLQGELPYIEEYFRQEEAAYKLASLLEIPMAETFYIEVDGKPWSAALFIEGARDRGMGGSFTQNVASIGTDLAKISLFKFIIKAGGDNGQYLEAPENHIFIMDVQLRPPSKLNPSESSPDLLRDALNFKRGTRPFGATVDTIKAQLQAIEEGAIDETIYKSQQLTQDTIEKIMASFNGVDSETNIIYAKDY